MIDLAGGTAADKRQVAGGRADALLGYRPLPGIADEMIDPQGKVRPSGSIFSAISAGRMSSRLPTVSPPPIVTSAMPACFYRAYGGPGTSERDWPLSHIPVMIAEDEWAKISEGLVQRAELLEHIVADIYGECRLVRDGLLPPPLVAANPEFLRPIVGLAALWRASSAFLLLRDRPWP